MKGLISGIKRMEIHDGDGLRTTVFFKGCPLKCIWCHNPESISFEKQIAFYKNKCIDCNGCKSVCPLNDTSRNVLNTEKCLKCLKCAEVCPTGATTVYGKEYTLNELLDILLTDELFYKNSGGGVTLSGGECLAQPEFAIALAKQLFEKQISVYIDTCGFVKREVLERIIPYTDKFLYDIKAIDSKLHKELTGQDNDLIIKNVKFLSDFGCDIEIRYPLVKGYNDGEYIKIAEFFKSLRDDIKIKVLQYHSYSRSRYCALGMEDTMPITETTQEDLNSVMDFINNKKMND